MTIAARIALEDPKRAAIRRLVPYVFVALWCAGFSFIKVGLVHAEPMTYLALRHGLCLLVFASLAVAIRPTLPASAGHPAGLNIAAHELIVLSIQTKLPRLG